MIDITGDGSLIAGVLIGIALVIPFYLQQQREHKADLKKRALILMDQNIALCREVSQDDGYNADQRTGALVCITKIIDFKTRVK